MFRTILLFIYISALLDAKVLGLDSLLTKYNQESERYKQTKKDAGGEFIVFTREDLSRMHVRELNDILYLLKTFNLSRSRVGDHQLGLSSTPSSVTTPIKIFINHHELSSESFGNVVIRYGDMNLDFIDYIEVYQAGNSVSFGNESGTVIVRLFTKDPSRENGSFAKMELDDKGSSALNILSAYNLEDKKSSYLISANLKRKNGESYYNNNYELKNDFTKANLFFQYNKKDDYSVEFNAVKGIKDSFANDSLSPTYGIMQGNILFLHLDKQLPQNFALRLCATYEKINIDNTDAVGIKLSNGTLPKNVHIDLHTLNTKVILEKEMQLENNFLFFGAQLQRVKFVIDDFRADGVVQTGMFGEKRNLFSIYGENTYHYNNDTLFVAGLKYNRYSDNNSVSQADGDLIFRVGNVSYLGKLKNKFFVFNRVIRPSMMQESFSPIKVKANPNLKSAETFIYSEDLTYQVQKNSSLHVGIAVAKFKNSIGTSPVLHQYINNPNTLHLKRPYVGFEHKFDLENKIKFEVYKVFLENTHFSPNSGGVLQLFNKIGKLDILGFTS